MRLHYCVLDELKARGIIRQATAPIGEYAELLLCEALDWTRVEKHYNPGFDATDKDGARVQIKARRITGAGSRQIGSFRNLEQRPFDKLAAVLFAKNLEIVRAAIIPLEIVKRMSVYDKYTKGFRLMLEDALWETPDVKDVTEQVRMAAAE